MGHRPTWFSERSHYAVLYGLMLAVVVGVGVIFHHFH